MEARSTVRALFAMLVAVVFGGGAVVFLVQLIGGYQASLEHARQHEDTVMVMVASRDLYPGVTITPEDLVAVAIEPRYLTNGVYLTPDHLIGQRPHERILMNEPVRASRLANPDTGEGLNAILPRTMRALSVEISDAAALSGFLEPGNYVDVVVTTAGGEGKRAEAETRTVLQAMFVLAVNHRAVTGDQATGRGAGRGTVTLMTTPEQAKLLSFAEQVGDLQFTLRNSLDLDELAHLTGARRDQLVKVEAFVKSRSNAVRKRPVAIVIDAGEADPSTQIVDVIEGSERTSVEVPVGDGL